MSHCTHWTDRGEKCCDCGHVFPHDGTEQYTTSCPAPDTTTPENVDCPTPGGDA